MGKVIGDIGSCHGGSLVLAKEAISTGAACGLDAVKFQLFKESAVNIPLPYDYFPELVSYGKDFDVEVFASVWDTEGFELVWNNCRSIKFAYSQRNSDLIKNALRVENDKKNGHITKQMESIYVSCGVMDKHTNRIIRLFCIPEYPVPYRVSFEGLFDGRFYGFSDHTLGISQAIEASRNNAQVIEKHFQLGKVDCPDARFAIMPHELKKLCKEVKECHGL